MEDGSALTPIVANHIITPTGFHPSALAASNQHNSLSYLPAIQHVRLLAKLCDCPVYQRTAATKSPFNTNSSQFGVSTSGIETQQQQQQQQQQLSIADEIKANALTFECLRHKPIEQIMQPVPLDLLQFNQAGELSIATRWLRSLAVAGQQTDSGSSQEASRLSFQLNEELTQVDSSIINKLQLAAIREQLDRDRASFAVELSAPNEEVRMSELFGALYAPVSSTIRPIFGPVEDGTIVPDEDIAGGMLKNGSTFAQRDLFIGLSQPVISSTPEGASSSDKMMGNLQPEQQETPFELGPDHILVDRITAHMQQVGLTNEQAVSLVNVFVRSFYRYHNQEITNSIINHYLSNDRVVKVRKLATLRKSHLAQSGNETDNRDSKIIHQQLFVLNSLLEAFHDSLISVPVLKTSLIHAIKQLDPLAEAFIGQQFEKWKHNEQLAGGGEPSTQYDSLTQMDNLQESFTMFAQSLFNDTNWPLELHSPSNLAVQQPKATYLYQFDSFASIRRLQNLIDQLTAKSSVSFGWKSVKGGLETLLMKLQDSGSRRRLGFECIMKVNFDDEVYISDNDDSGQYILEKFSDWICAKYTSILGEFISSGNIKAYNLVNGNTNNLQEDSLDWTPMSERITRFDAECSSFKQPYAGDHHSVQVNGLETQGNNINGTCRHELNSMILDYIISEFETQAKPDNDLKWSVFDIFTQHLATIPTQRELWHIGPITDGDLSTQQDQKSTFSARSSFWANFIPALNCTKTQPVIPISLLSSSKANSSLLNLNLIFNCLHGGKTSYDVFESVVSFIKQQLQTKLMQWRLSQSNSSAGQQNHHSLRMANIGQTNAMDENLDTQDHLSSELGGRFNGTNHNDLRSPSGFIEANGGNVLNANQAYVTSEMRIKYAGLVLIFCALVVSVTLAYGACAVIKQRRQNRDQKREKMETQINLDTIEQQQQQSQETSDSQEQLKNSLLSNDTDAQTSSQTNAHTATNNGRDMIISENTRSMEYNLQESPPVQLNHVCTLNNGPNGYIYWDDGQQVILDNSVALYRSHSSLNTLNNGNLVANNNLTTATSLLDQTRVDQEPIMMPILTGAPQGVVHQRQSQTSSLRRTGCLSNSLAINGFQGDSSSETQDHSRQSTSKKRVQISDSIGTTRSISRDIETNCKHRTRHTNGQARFDDPLFCPVHRDQAINTMQEQIDAGFHIDEQGLLSNHGGSWNGEQINLVDSQQFIPSMNESNCDHYSASNGSSQQPILYDTYQNYKHNYLNYNDNYDPLAAHQADYRTMTSDHCVSNYHQQQQQHK